MPLILGGWWGAKTTSCFETYLLVTLGITVPVLPAPPEGLTKVRDMVAEPKKCRCKKRDGSPCPNRARTGKATCWIHDPDLAQQRAEGRRRGGLNRLRPATTLPDDTPVAPLATVQDVAALLAATINQVRTGKVAVQVGNCVGVLAGVLIKAIEGGDLERRLVALEQGAIHRRRIA